MQSLFRRVLPLAAALALAACGQQELHRDLGEAQANAIVAALAEEGISSSKEGGEEGSWSVGVAKGDFAGAVRVLRAQGLPGENFVSLGEVFEKEGFTSSPLEERARLIYGLSQELSRTVSAIDGVVQARVHLTLPEADPLTREVPASAASVFVKYRPGFSVESQTGAIKTLVANSIEGISYERVSVVMVPAAAVAQSADSGAEMGSGLQIALIALALALAIGGVVRLLAARRADPADRDDTERDGRDREGSLNLAAPLGKSDA